MYLTQQNLAYGNHEETQVATALNKGFLSIYERCNLHFFGGLNDCNDKPNQTSENKITLSNTLGHLGMVFLAMALRKYRCAYLDSS